MVPGGEGFSLGFSLLRHREKLDAKGAGEQHDRGLAKLQFRLLGDGGEALLGLVVAVGKLIGVLGPGQRHGQAPAVEQEHVRLAAVHGGVRRGEVVVDLLQQTHRPVGDEAELHLGEMRGHGGRQYLRPVEGVLILREEHRPDGEVGPAHVVRGVLGELEEDGLLAAFGCRGEHPDHAEVHSGEPSFFAEQGPNEVRVGAADRLAGGSLQDRDGDLCQQDVDLGVLPSGLEQQRPVPFVAHQPDADGRQGEFRLAIEQQEVDVGLGEVVEQ